MIEEFLALIDGPAFVAPLIGVDFVEPWVID